MSLYLQCKCTGQYTVQMALADAEAIAQSKGKTLSGKEKEDFTAFFKECSQAVDSKQLRPQVTDREGRREGGEEAGRSP